MEELRIQYQSLDSWKQLPDEEKELVEKAYGASEKAYAPYSNFNVGACLLLEDGTTVLGNNQENAAFPSGTCAERTALFYAGANFPDKKIKTLVVVAKGDFVDIDRILSPCGGCRQVMLESEKRQETPIKVILVSQNERTIALNSVSDLLPFAFSNSKK
ncbi:MAG: cytidine deaminase [Crocinitomicaceae bacterium]|nr:cytidine deaminase [Crocinitomicaceae bacterium]NGF75404.1 cytidine deaminase [Fluviicola sp. SGL-29]